MSEAAPSVLAVGDVVRAFGRSFSRSAGAIVLLALGVSLVESALTQLVLVISPPSPIPSDNLVAGLLGLSIGLVGTSFEGAALTHTVVARRKGHTPTVGESMRWALARLPTVLLTTFVATIAMLVGLAFLVLPGVYVSLLLFVATAVAAMEKVGPIEALTRSRELSRAHVGTIFLANFVLSPLFFGGYVVAAFLHRSMYDGDLSTALARIGTPSDVPTAMLSALAVATTSATVSVYCAALYRLLARKPKKGLGERVARVFE